MAMLGTMPSLVVSRIPIPIPIGVFTNMKNCGLCVNGRCGSFGNI